METSRNVAQVGVDDASKHLCCVNGGVLHVQEAYVIAVVAEEKLLFKASIHIGECAVLGLKKWAEALPRCDDIEIHKKVITG